MCDGVVKSGEKRPGGILQIVIYGDRTSVVQLLCHRRALCTEKIRFLRRVAGPCFTILVYFVLLFIFFIFIILLLAYIMVFSCYIVDVRLRLTRTDLCFRSANNKINYF